MPHQLHNSLARILTPDGSPVGVGFLAASNLPLTCVHVIDQAIGQEENAHFDFPILALRGTLEFVIQPEFSVVQ